MCPVLDRFLAGEQKDVWDELFALGGRVREDDHYTEAVAVARETMRRARHNITVLVSRLESVDFAFGPYWWQDERYPWSTPDQQATFPSVFAPPKPHVGEQLAELEHLLGGPLPLSLRAWYEHIGSVCLIGNYPVEDPGDPEGFTNARQNLEVDPMRERLRDYEDAVDWSDRHDLDPLFVFPIEDALYWFQRAAKPRSVISIAPDEFFKYNFSGGDAYQISVPNAAADALLLGEWHETTFVDYLRICFRWGGFPGLHTRRRIPWKELSYLTEGLLPI